jgi:hypothetical protein
MTRKVLNTLLLFSGCDIGEERAGWYRPNAEAEQLVVDGLLQRGKIKNRYKYYSLTEAGKAELRKRRPEANL